MAVANTLEPLIFMAEQGLGIAFLPDFAIGRQLREGDSMTIDWLEAIYIVKRRVASS